RLPRPKTSAQPLKSDRNQLRPCGTGHKFKRCGSLARNRKFERVTRVLSKPKITVGLLIVRKCCEISVPGWPAYYLIFQFPSILLFRHQSQGCGHIFDDMVIEPCRLRARTDVAGCG